MIPSTLSKTVRGIPAHGTQCLLLTAIMIVVIVGQFLISFGVYGDMSMSITDNVKRVNLIKNITRNPQNISVMRGDDIAMIMREPSLARVENTVTAWHYHGESCSLDVYFSDVSERPVYIEYRPLSLNDNISVQYAQTNSSDVNYYCLKDVLNSQGISTPENYARQPIPSWDNPYQS